MLASAHASHEELLLLQPPAEDPKGDAAASHVHVAWRRTEKQQPANTTFRVPAVDAPNVNGARDLGLAVAGDGDAAIGDGVAAIGDGDADLSALRTAIDQGRVAVLYIVDPGPEGSMGDLTWLLDARKAGRVPVIIYQGVLQSELSKAADVVLPGAAWVEKDATYTNDQGMVQAASKAIAPPGDALEDRHILVKVGRALGLSMPYESSTDVRRAIAAAMPGTAYADADRMAFTRPQPASTWLQTSNPSERWKWDFLFQDLPPVKGHSVQVEGLPPEIAFIPLKSVG
jgi:NADH-quinone oxidoreductase subunit G